MSDFADLLAVLAHEMRSPLAAIMGYQELLSEGIYGTVDERGKEPLSRIGYSARQLLHLLDGLHEIAMPSSTRLDVELEPIAPAESLRLCLHNAGPDAVGRNVKLETVLPEDLPEIMSNDELFCRSIDLALSAAIKTSHGSTLRFTAADGDERIRITIENTGLDPERDNPELAQPNMRGRLTGAGLRLAILREIAKKLQGDVELIPTASGTTLALQFRAAAAN